MTDSFQQNLERYAELAVRIGANLRPGQRLLLETPIEAAPLARLITAAAYRAGARLVDVLWADDALDLIRFQHAPRDSFEEFPIWFADLLTDYARSGDAVMSIAARDPDLLSGQDPELVGVVQKTTATYIRPYIDELMRSSMNWTIISAPIASWAAKMFPDEPAERQTERLWEAIFATCRLDQPDPIAAWNKHLDSLTARADYLNGKRYRTLKYTGPGTDLSIGLSRGHVWKSARETSAKGIVFTPNLPTEEVFTMPHRAETSGVVSATKPLNYGGTLIQDFRLTFAEGRVVEAHARAGEETLRTLLATDEGATRLGEVALVPHGSPIAQSGLLFYNTLFDENAASHIALGRAYNFTLEGGTSMPQEQLEAAGANQSLTHVDFMIGSGELDIDGVREDGSVEPVMRAGEWSFSV